MSIGCQFFFCLLLLRYKVSFLYSVMVILWLCKLHFSDSFTNCFLLESEDKRGPHRYNEQLYKSSPWRSDHSLWETSLCYKVLVNPTSSLSSPVLRRNSYTWSYYFRLSHGSVFDLWSLWYPCKQFPILNSLRIN